jgi:hypothetical protein
MSTAGTGSVRSIRTVKAPPATHSVVSGSPVMPPAPEPRTRCSLADSARKIDRPRGQKFRPRISRKTGAGSEYRLVLTSKNVPWRFWIPMRMLKPVS